MKNNMNSYSILYLHKIYKSYFLPLSLSKFSHLVSCYFLKISYNMKVANEKINGDAKVVIDNVSRIMHHEHSLIGSYYKPLWHQMTTKPINKAFFIPVPCFFIKKGTKKWYIKI